jgi:hypothetical protein
VSIGKPLAILPALFVDAQHACHVHVRTLYGLVMEWHALYDPDPAGVNGKERGAAGLAGRGAELTSA